MYEGALGMGLLTLKRFRGGGLGGGELLLWGPWKICSDSLRIWVSLLLGAPVVPSGTVSGGEVLIPGTLKDG